MSNFENIKKRYNELKSEREKYTSRWEEISKYIGTRVRASTYVNSGEVNKGEDLDKYTEDPTASLSVQQSADYLKGIMWGNGDNAISLLPTDEVLELVDKSAVDGWYEYATKKLLREINHPNSGFNGALSAYFYDMSAFGTAGIGAFPNSRKDKGHDDNVLIFRPYGIDTLCIDEGKNGMPEVVFNTYQWRCNRLVSEFCERNGKFDEKIYAQLPDKVKQAYEHDNLNQTFTIVQAILPRDDYNPRALGKNGCKYVGYWFEESQNEAFFEEDYKDLPIAVARAIKIRGEVYGRASGSMLISSIRCINQAISDCMVAMGKMVNPPIGVLNSAIFGDDVVDTSENGLTVLNAAMLQGQAPIIPMQDVGDISSLVQWLVPYLNEKVATAFKIDILLDFSAGSDMTATEAMQRYSIRGRSISGMIMQQKMELFDPLLKRCISVCYDKGVLGLDPIKDAKEIAELMERGINDRTIPDAVIECIRQGKPWYKIKFNNEVDRLGKTEHVDDLMKMVNMASMLMQLNPQMSAAVNWYQLMADVTESLGLQKNIYSENEFKKQVAAQAQQQQAMVEAQQGLAQSQINKNNAGAMKDLINE
jgi:hypothetical protein